MILFLVLLGLSLPTWVWGETSLFGYFENRFFTLIQEDDTQLGDYNRLRLKLKANPSEMVNFNLALDFYSFHGNIASPLGTYGENTPQTINLDRAYVNIYFKHFDLSIGKQRIAMGVSYIWAPLDLFNRVNIMEPKEEKPGTNAFKIYIPLGASTSITGVFSPEADFSSSKSGLRGKTQILGIDIALTLIQWGLEETTVYGIDLRGEHGIGWWFEGGLFVRGDQREYKYVAGFDYTFPIGNNIYWLNEYFFDSSGVDNLKEYDLQLLISGERFTLGKHYFFSMVRYSFSELLSGSLSYIANWGDGSYILNPNVSYDLSDNILVSSGIYLPLGTKGGEFHTGDTQVIYVWLKINF